MNTKLYMFPGLLIAFLLGGNVCIAADKSHKEIKPIICAINTLYECDGISGCQQRSPEELDVPNFLKILIDKREIYPAGAVKKGSHKSRILNIARIYCMIIMQGVEDGDAKQKDGVGWTISINETSGKMAITASGQEEAFVGLGACFVDK